MHFGSNERSELESRLIVLRGEHRDLDEAIMRLMEGAISDELLIRRLKKRKLAIKDRITLLEDLLVPDEPA